jgi:hypothetical protein
MTEQERKQFQSALEIEKSLLENLGFSESYIAMSIGELADELIYEWACNEPK